MFWVTVCDLATPNWNVIVTFRRKGAISAWLDKLGLFLSLALCNKANFGYL